MNDHIFYRFIRTESKVPRGIIVVTHGYRAHSAAHQNLVRTALRRGYHVMIWDMPGFGRSSGEHGYIANFSELITGLLKVLAITLRRNHHLPIFLIGHSTGASVIFVASRMYLLGNGYHKILSRIHGEIAVDPAFSVLHNVSWMWRALSPLAPLLLFPRFLHRISVGSTEPEAITHEPSVIKWMKRDRHFYRGPLFLKPAWEIHRGGRLAWRYLRQKKVHWPVLLVFGQDDDIAQAPNEKALRSLGGNVSLTIYPGLKHDPVDGRGSRPGKVRHQILNWLDACTLTDTSR